jgi:glucose-specific phosphotransferase system IIA component
MALFGNKTNNDEIIVVSPVDGKVKELKKVNDPVFAEKMVGDGVAVTPANDVVKSPINGKIKVTMPTKHAYGIASKQGPEMLIHIGVDTVALDGEGFEQKTAEGKSVKTTSDLATIDLDVINKKAKSSDIMVLVTNDSIDG